MCMCMFLFLILYINSFICSIKSMLVLNKLIKYLNVKMQATLYKHLKVIRYFSLKTLSMETYTFLFIIIR